MADALNVETAGGDVGGDQDIDLAIFELLNRAFALLLVQIAIDGCHREATGIEFRSQFFSTKLGTRKNDHAVESFGFQNARQGVELVHAADEPITLTDIVGGTGFGSDRDFGRLVQVSLGDALDGRRHGGREQGGLTAFRCFLQNTFDIVDETHAQHFIGFVEHEGFDF